MLAGAAHAVAAGRCASFGVDGSIVLVLNVCIVIVSVPGTLRVGFVDSLVPLLVHVLDWVVAAGACTVVPVFHLVLVCLAVFFMVA